jgi:radical SAM superfamily enzyme YgiQ (UPF0313 family)
MKVKFITMINAKINLKQDIGIEMMNQVLLDKGYDSETVNFYYDYKFIHAISVKNAEYVCELRHLPLLLKIIENYKNKRLIIENIDDSIPVDFGTPIQKPIKEMDQYIDSLDISDGDVFCLSTNYVSIVPMIFYALKLKSMNKNIKVVFGGHHVTLSKYSREIILRLDISDALVINDGVGVILDIIEGKKTGLVDGVYVKNPRMPDFDKTKINDCDWVTSMSSVGCPNNCTYCCSDRQWVGFDINYIEDHNRSLVEKYPNIKFYYADDNVNTSIERFDAFADMIVRLGRPWKAFANPIKINDEIAKKLSSVPSSIFVGAEGFSNELLKHLGKPGLNVSIVKSGVGLLAKNGINVSLGLIIGLPGETKKIFKQTDDACKDLIQKYGSTLRGGLLDIIPTPFKVFPNSQNYWKPEKFNIKFEFWEDEYINRIPEISDILKNIPKKFFIESRDHGIIEERVLKMRKEYGLPTGLPIE